MQEQKMEFEKVYLNQFGYYELKKKPTPEERKKEFEEDYYQNSRGSYAQQYSEEEQKFFHYKSEQKELMIRKELGNTNLFSLLDIGCGEGFVLSYFHSRGNQVTGIDFSEYGIRNQNPDMLPYLLCGDCDQILPQLIQENRKYDVINMDAALDMMLNPEQVVGYCKELLAENGVLVIKVANNYSPLQIKLLQEGKLTKEHWLDETGHISYFNKDGLIRFMDFHGYTCANVYGEGYIELNLFNDSTNYYEHKDAGKGCYQSKIEIENMLHEISPKQALEVFRILGNMGWGREIAGVFKKKNT